MDTESNNSLDPLRRERIELYLLGKLDKKELESMEWQVFSQESAFFEILVVEEALIEKYIYRADLLVEEREDLEVFINSSKERFEKMLFIKALQIVSEEKYKEREAMSEAKTTFRSKILRIFTGIKRLSDLRYEVVR